MVLCGISWKGRNVMVRIKETEQHYVDEIVEPVIVPYLQRCLATIFQQDSARPYSAGVTQHTLQRNGVQVLLWPVRSPDSLRIENV